jgi:CBS domain-containing protein
MTTARGPESRVKDLVVRDVVSVRPDDPLNEAVTLMFENRISAVPVVDTRGRCRGILSTTDLIGLLGKLSESPVEPDEMNRFAAEIADANQRSARLEQRKVEEVMTRDVITVGLEDTVLAAAREMLRNRVHRLIVVDQHQRVIGILSTMDLLEAFSAGC